MGSPHRALAVASTIVAAGASIVAVLLLLIGLDPVILGALLLTVAAGALGLAALARRLSRIEGRPATGRLVVGATALSAVLTFALIQLVPYGRDHSNPPTTGEPRWASDRTRQLMVDGCFACHSNEVEYPAYASVAPLSWAVQRHIDEGRRAVNYSEFATDPGDADESVEELQDGEMPPPYFTRFGRHPEARFSEEELRELVDGLRATPGMTEHDGSSDHD